MFWGVRSLFGWFALLFATVERQSALFVVLLLGRLRNEREIQKHRRVQSLSRIEKNRLSFPIQTQKKIKFLKNSRKWENSTHFLYIITFNICKLSTHVSPRKIFHISPKAIKFFRKKKSLRTFRNIFSKKWEA